MPLSLPLVPLQPFCETARFREMDRLEQYFRNKQDDHKRYDWDGNMRSIGGVDLHTPEPVDYDVAYSQRRPNARYNLPKVIVLNLTQMTLGGASFPEVNVEGDEPAEKALREWSKIMRLSSRIAEARNFGGAQGTACWSLGVSQGRFRVDVHNPKHCTVLEWRDRANFIPASVMKAYSFQRTVVETGQMVKKTFWYVRYWDEVSDMTWEQVPSELAEQPDWFLRLVPSYSFDHGWEFCPFYWVQNLSDSQEEDGEGDYEGLDDKFDELNALISSTSRGGRKNVDPTMVVHKEDDEEQVRKGSSAVIYSPEGAEYLEMKGTGVDAALAIAGELRQIALEEAQCVIPREDKITGAAQSAAAMRILYRPMIAKCNLLRDQYGPAIARTLDDVLRVARKIRARVRDVVDSTGMVIRKEREMLTPDLDPGTGEGETGAKMVTLRWPEYFEPTSQDVKDAVSTAQSASGNKPVISHRTAVDYTARLFGIADVDEEMEQIETEAQEAVDQAADMMEREAAAFGKGPAGAAAAGAAK